MYNALSVMPDQHTGKSLCRCSSTFAEAFLKIVWKDYRKQLKKHGKKQLQKQLHEQLQEQLHEQL